ncbi:hypothetical protein VUR80DRAFT_9584 [Thermomyces stellatus]
MEDVLDSNVVSENKWGMNRTGANRQGLPWWPGAHLEDLRIGRMNNGLPSPPETETRGASFHHRGRHWVPILGINDSERQSALVSDDLGAIRPSHPGQGRPAIDHYQKGLLATRYMHSVEVGSRSSGKRAWAVIGCCRRRLPCRRERGIAGQHFQARTSA